MREIRARGVLEVQALDAFAVLCDVRRYPAYVPHLRSVEILDEDGAASAVAHQVLEMPMLAPRDTTVRLRCTTEFSPRGERRFVLRWKEAHDVGPPPARGVIRVPFNEGSWSLEPLDDGRRTRATYVLFADPGGHVPAFLVNAITAAQIPLFFRSLEREAQARVQ